MLSKKAELWKRARSGRCDVRPSRKLLAHAYDDGVERIDLSAVRSACRQRWANGSLWDERAVKVLIGEAADGRWYVWRYGGGPERVIAYGPANAEHYARKTAERWKRTIGGEWAEA